MEWTNRKKKKTSVKGVCSGHPLRDMSISTETMFGIDRQLHWHGDRVACVIPTCGVAAAAAQGLEILGNDCQIAWRRQSQPVGISCSGQQQG